MDRLTKSIALIESLSGEPPQWRQGGKTSSRKSPPELFFRDQSFSTSACKAHTPWRQSAQAIQLANFTCRTKAGNLGVRRSWSTVCSRKIGKWSVPKIPFFRDSSPELAFGWLVSSRCALQLVQFIPSCLQHCDSCRANMLGGECLP